MTAGYLRNTDTWSVTLITMLHCIRSCWVMLANQAACYVGWALYMEDGEFKKKPKMTLQNNPSPAKSISSKCRDGELGVTHHSSLTNFCRHVWKNKSKWSLFQSHTSQLCSGNMNTDEPHAHFVNSSIKSGFTSDLKLEHAACWGPTPYTKYIICGDGAYT